MHASGTKYEIEAVLSDLGKVAVLFDNRRTSAALLQHSSYYNEKGLHDMLFVHHRDQWDAYMRGERTTAQFTRFAKGLLQLTCTDAAFHRAMTNVFTPHQPILKLWEALSLKGVRLVTASNIDELRHQELLRLGVLGGFNAHCLSYQVGCAKPDPRFFVRALELAETDPRRTLFVDDHEEFAEAARALGIHAETYDHQRHADFVQRLGERYAFVAKR